MFMGDTGSLAIGGALGALAVLTDTYLPLLFATAIFAIEAASVVAQASLP